MFIAGAFGLWGITMTAESEGRRRVGRFVDEMDYINDAVLTVDRRGRITGCNPAAHRLGYFGEEESPALSGAFPCLSPEDVESMVRPEEPVEIERLLQNDSVRRMLRFRAQKAQGLALVLISDVTQMNTKRLRNRQMARLQLLEHIAKGVAHDVNTLLCGISGQASLLSRMPSESAEGVAALGAIDEAARHGSLLAGRLMGLVRQSSSAVSRTEAAEPVEVAAGLLRDSLSRGWRVDVSAEPIPPTAMSATQLEQVVLNLGFLVADAHASPGTVSISVQDAHRLRAKAVEYAGAVVIKVKDEVDSSPTIPERAAETGPEPGMIQSVLETVVGECGGKIEALQSRALAPVYVVWLPRAEPVSVNAAKSELSEELAAYVSEWRVLLASTRPRHALRDRLSALGTRVDVVDNVVSALAHVEGSGSYEGAVFDINMLRHEAAGLLRALVKLSPSTGFVACGESKEEFASLSSDIVFVPEWASPDRIVLGMMEARTLGLKRTRV
jgi:two-component system cell cycle sensor histidine kinase/response regulator CckA